MLQFAKLEYLIFINLFIFISASKINKYLDILAIFPALLLANSV